MKASTNILETRAFKYLVVWSVRHRRDGPDLSGWSSRQKLPMSLQVADVEVSKCLPSSIIPGMALGYRCPLLPKLNVLWQLQGQ